MDSEVFDNKKGQISLQQSFVNMTLMGLDFTYELLLFIAFLMMLRPNSSDKKY